MTIQVPSAQAWVITSAPINDNPKTPHRYTLAGPAPDYVEFNAFGAAGINPGACVQVHAGKNAAGTEFLRIFNVLDPGNGVYTRQVQEPEEFVPELKDVEVEVEFTSEEEPAMEFTPEEPVSAIDLEFEKVVEEPVSEEPAPKQRRSRKKKEVEVVEEPQQDVVCEDFQEFAAEVDSTNKQLLRKADAIADSYITIATKLKDAGLGYNSEVIVQLVSLSR